MAKVREVMTKDPVVLEQSTSLVEGARTMRERDIGAVIVFASGRLVGVATDRDIVIRGVAEGNIGGMTLGDVCSRELHTISPDEPIERAVQLMREHSVRRLPVVEGGRPIGILSLGDLAVEKDPGSALGDISSAAPNR